MNTQEGSSTEYLTVKETATLLKVSPITVRRYIASGKLQADRVGRGIRIQRTALDRFVVPFGRTTIPQDDSGSSEPAMINELLGISFGIGRSREPSNIAEHKDEYIADAILASRDEYDDEADDIVDTPLTEDDPLWDIVGMGRSGEPNDVARNKHKALADGELARWRQA